MEQYGDNDLIKYDNRGVIEYVRDENNNSYSPRSGIIDFTDEVLHDEYVEKYQSVKNYIREEQHNFNIKSNFYVVYVKTKANSQKTYGEFFEMIIGSKNDSEVNTLEKEKEAAADLAS